jgi:Na+-translocating ferredoxin:NAD+ oxidoreductase RnfC subunit
MGRAAGAHADFEQRDAGELRERIRQSGIVGMGGASSRPASS